MSGLRLLSNEGMTPRVSRRLTIGLLPRAPGGTAGSRMLLVLCIVGFLFLTTSPPAVAQEPTPPESTYATEDFPPSSVGTSLLIGGAAATGGFYALGLGTSLLFPDAPNAKSLRIPIAGAFIALGDVGCGPEEGDCDTVTVVARTIVASLSALGQAGGLALMVEGLFLPTSPSQRASAGRRERRPIDTAGSARDGDWYAAPFSSRDGFGLLFGGTF